MMKIAILEMRIIVTGTMNDHKNGLFTKLSLFGMASQQLLRKTNYFSRPRKEQILIPFAINIIGIHGTEVPANNILASYTSEVTFNNSATIPVSQYVPVDSKCTSN